MTYDVSLSHFRVYFIFARFVTQLAEINLDKYLYDPEAPVSFG